MGITNFCASVERRYSALTGELEDVRLSIERIKREAEKLGKLEARIPDLERLIESAGVLMRDADSNWSPDQTEAIKPRTHHISLPFGHWVGEDSPACEPLTER